MRKEKDAILNNVTATVTKSGNQKKDNFLEGFNNPYGEKREQEPQQKEPNRKEKFANIRANADNRTWPSQEEMQGKHPIVLLTETGDRYESEHYVVIVGCYINENGERYVVVNETGEEKTELGINGAQKHIPYEKFKGIFSTGRGASQKIKSFYTTRPTKDSTHK